jgi:hypothetical protein
MPESTPEPLPLRQPGTNRTPDAADTLQPAFGFSWADPDTRPAAWTAFGEPTEQGEQ